MSEYFKENVRFVIVRKFIHPAEARIYEVRILEAGIRCFLSNTNTSQLLPFSDGGIALHVAEHQLEEANEIIDQLDVEASRPADEDFREADHDDIEFARQMNERDNRLRKGDGRWVLVLLIVIGIALLILAVVQGYRYF